MMTGREAVCQRLPLLLLWEVVDRVLVLTVLATSLLLPCTLLMVLACVLLVPQSFTVAGAAAASSNEAYIQYVVCSGIDGVARAPLPFRLAFRS